MNNRQRRDKVRRGSQNKINLSRQPQVLNMRHDRQALHIAEMLVPNGALEVRVTEEIKRNSGNDAVFLHVLAVLIFHRVIPKPLIGPAAEVVLLAEGEGARFADFDIFDGVTGDVVIEGVLQPFFGKRVRNFRWGGALIGGCVRWHGGDRGASFIE